MIFAGKYVYVPGSLNPYLLDEMGLRWLTNSVESNQWRGTINLAQGKYGQKRETQLRNR